MENSPLDPVETLETRYAAAKRDLAQEPAAAPRTPGANVDTIFIRRIGGSGSMRADRSGKRRMGHRMTVTRRVPTQPPTGSSGACRAAGCIARLVMRGDASNAPLRVRRTCARRSLERRHARRARHRGAARILPRAGPTALESGKSGAWEAGTDTARFMRRGDGIDVRVTGVVLGHFDGRHGHAAGNRSGNVRPLAIRRSVRTPASSRSDRRPDAPRRR